MPAAPDPVVDFNQANRDAWVAGIAGRLPAGARILDVGAGQCRYRRLFAHCDYKAQDFAGYTGTAGGELKEDWRYGELDYVCDAASIPVADGSFDAVLCTEVLEHVPEPVGVLREIGRILRPGGQAFISAPLGSGLHQQPYHYYGGFTPHFYRKFLPACGLEVLSIEPNGRFFRLLLQELHRGLGIIFQRKQYRRWRPAYWTLRLVRNRRLFRWLARLDDEIPIDEFTAGYHVEARKPSNTGGGCA
jgi:SAM-dependent methyltransferase